MKIIHIGQLIGGLDIYIRNSILYSQKQNDYIIIHGYKDNNNPIIKDGKTIKEYKISLFRELNPIKDIKGLWQTIKIIQKEKPDIIHCHSAKGGFIGRIAGFITGTKTFYTPHAFSFLSTNNKLKKQLYLYLEKIAKLNSYLLACSESEQYLGTDIVGYKKKKALVWNNAVPKPKEIKEPSDINFPYICYIGRPSYQKNIFFLLDIIKNLHTTHPQIKFLLLGVGYYSPDLNKVKTIIKEENLDDTIKLLPWLNHEETLGYVNKALFYMSVAKYEGLPLAVIEAMSLGKAIIASDVVGNKDCVKDNYNGFLIPLNEKDFIDKIDYLINNDDKRKEFEKNSLLYFEESFKIENRIKLLENIYETGLK